MRYLHLLSFLFITMFFLGSCDRKESIYLQPKAYSQVDERLWPYFQSFEKEAAARNLDIDLDLLNVKGSIEIINIPNYVGLCDHQNQGGKLIIIDSNFWERSDNKAIESIVFHELAHCVLGQRHRNESFENGMCKSLMRSGFVPCLTLYNSNRDYYLDELFTE